MCVGRALTAVLPPCRKEKLWPHIREFADRAIAHTRKTLIALSEAGTPCELYTVHGHYADAGEVAALMSSTLGIDMVMTGHSLGRNKLEHLLGEPALLPASLMCDALLAIHTLLPTPWQV